MIESWDHLAVIFVEFVYDVWIIEVFRVPIEETADWWLVLTEMCNHDAYTRASCGAKSYGDSCVAASLKTSMVRGMISAIPNNRSR
jgi:hypothetical protein